MDLTDDEIRDLATFLARRVTPDGQRPDPTDAPAAGRTPVEVWRERLSSARASGRLGSLVREAAAAAPADRALQEACTLLARGPAERSGLGRLLATGAAAALAIALLAIPAGGVIAALQAAPPGPADIVSAVRIHPHSQIRSPSPGEPEASVPAIFADADAATSAGNAGPDALAPRVAPGLPAQGVATRVPRVEDGPPEGPMERGACSGWFYAGQREPGESFVVEQRTNVRVVYPSRENGWNRRGHITCVLSAGREVRLAGEPVELPGGHWWAPIGSAGAVEIASAD